MKYNGLFFILAAIMAFFFAMSDVSRLALLKSQTTEPSVKSDGAQVTSTIQAPTVEAHNKTFIINFKTFFSDLGSNYANSDLAEKKLKEFAKKMTDQDVENLYELISDDTNHTDMRSMAVDLLSIKNNTASLVALQNFVGNKKNIKGKPWDSKKELETVLRAQAVESISIYPQKEVALTTLNFLHEKVEQKFLRDRIIRATSSVLGEVRLSQDSDSEDENDIKNLIE